MKQRKKGLLRLMCALIMFAMLPTAVSANTEQTIVLDLGDGCIDISPTGYSQNGSEEVPFTGEYIITGSLEDDTPLDIVNYSGSPATFNITLDNAKIIGARWCTAVRIEGTDDIVLNLTNSGNSEVKGHNHPAIKINNSANVTINISNPDGEGLILESTYWETDTEIFDGVNAVCTINGESVGKDFVYQTTHSCIGQTSWRGSADGTEHWLTCTCGNVEQKEAHEAGEGEAATCVTLTKCSICGEGFGELDADNHTGNTELRNQKDATTAEKGYTGDIHCKDCGVLLELGTEIPMLEDTTQEEETTEATEEEKETTEEVKEESKEYETSPKTGDNSHIVFWTMMLFVSAGVFLVQVVFIGSKKENY